MRLTARVEHGRRVRVIQWSKGSSSDLTGVAVLAVATAACAVLSVTASATNGPLRVVCVVLAVLTGLLAAAIAVSVLAFAVGIATVRAFAAPQPTPLQRCLFVLPSLIVGGLLGLTVFETGAAGLLAGPALGAIIGAAAWSLTGSRRARARIAVLASLGAVTSVVVGVAILR